MKKKTTKKITKPKFPICPKCKTETCPKGMFYEMPNRYIKYLCSTKGCDYETKKKY